MMMRFIRLVLPTRRQLKGILLFTLFLWLVSSVGCAFAADPTTPIGMGELIPMPDLAGAGQKSLLEGTDMWGWAIVDNDLGMTEIMEKIYAGGVFFVWGLAVILARGAVGLTWWLFSFADVEKITNPLAGMIGKTSESLLTGLLPTAVIIGLLIAWTAHKRDMFSAIGWVLVAAVMGMSLALSPQTWVDATNSARAIGADAVMNFAGDGMDPNQNKPIAWEKTTYGAKPAYEDSKARTNVLMRRSGDALWRSTVATPWCLIEFGSLQACERYGAEMIKKGSDTEARKDFINGEISKREGGDNAATIKWLKGKKGVERLLIAVVSCIVVIIFCGFLLYLGLLAMWSVMSVFLHLIIGVFFTLTWCIEGPIRQLGLNWLNSMIVALLRGIFAMLFFAVGLILSTVLFTNLEAWGWLPVVALTIVGLFAVGALGHKIGGWWGHGNSKKSVPNVVRSLTRTLNRFRPRREKNSRPSNSRKPERQGGGNHPKQDPKPRHGYAPRDRRRGDHHQHDHRGPGRQRPDQSRPGGRPGSPSHKPNRRSDLPGSDTRGKKPRDREQTKQPVPASRDPKKASRERQQPQPRQQEKTHRHEPRRRPEQRQHRRDQQPPKKEG